MLPSVGLASSSRGARGRKDFTFTLIKAHSSAVSFAAGTRGALGVAAWRPSVAVGHSCWVSDTELSACGPCSQVRIREGESAGLQVWAVRLGAELGDMQPVKHERHG